MNQSNMNILNLGWNLGDELTETADYIEDDTFHGAPALFNYRGILIEPRTVSKLWTEYLRPEEDGSYVTTPQLDKGLAKGLENLLEARRKELHHMANATGGVIIVRFRQPEPKLEIKMGNDVKYIDRYSWLPEELANLFVSEGLIRTRGRKVSLTDRSSPAGNYLQSVESHISYEVAVSGKISPGPGWSFHPLAISENDEVVSFEFISRQGSILFLPPLEKISEKDQARQTINLIENQLGNRTKRRQEWLNNEGYSFDLEEEGKHEKTQIEEKISTLKRKKQQTVLKLKKLNRFKNLLAAGSDRELSELLEAILQDLDFTVKPANPHVDVYACADSENCFAINTGANPEGPVGIDSYHRLVRGIDELRIYEDVDPKGIFLANGYAETDPSERDVEVTDELRRGCNLYGFSILTAYQLFHVIREASNGEGTIREAVMNLLSES